MTVLRVVRRGSAAEMERERAMRLEPRDDIVAERSAGDDRYEAVGGPFRHYERRLQLTELDSGHPGTADGERDGGRYELVETTTYRLAVPVWAWLFHFPVRHALRHRRAVYAYWWAPPDRIDARASAVLGLLCTVQVLDGYLGTVLSQTLTFAADEFGHGNTAQGIVLAVVRVGVLVALASVALADRHGRRRLLLATGVASCVVTAVGALSPGLWFLGATQLLARGLSTALGILIVIVAAEEMPARSRAWAMSVLVLCAGLGSGMAVWVLPVADLHISAWRAVYVVPLAGVAVMVWVGRHLPESRRFEMAGPGFQPRDDRSTGIASDTEAAERRRRRLALLAASAFLIAMFAAPASGLRNDFLKDEREFSAAAISLFTVVTNTPIGIGVLAGGYLADRRGRRPVGAAGLVAGAVFVAWAYFTDGAALWSLTLAGGVLGAVAVPALAVYGPELFGTYRRGRANGLIVTVGVAGSALGLLVAGWLSDALDGRLGPALALLAVGPLAVAALVVWKYPETAGQELEELNPEDRDPSDPQAG
ncbi:MAG: MFS transporter [Acidimicrobiaceae bacterium]|nr:MFS transporter [Acidimicrobiaceae bacterium]MYH76726.1 MFS transporter [Acidimicrobiaceae bacterium]MYK77993.1 MFS transporter [Acidimicrobiaceae bacterium]